jgi:hypothetical protein
MESECHFFKLAAFLYKISLLGPSKPIRLFPFKTLLTWAGDLKGLSHEIDFDNIDKNLRMLALISAVAGF